MNKPRCIQEDAARRASETNAVEIEIAPDPIDVLDEKVEQEWAEGAIRRMHENNSMRAITEGWKNV